MADREARPHRRSSGGVTRAALALLGVLSGCADPTPPLVPALVEAIFVAPAEPVVAQPLVTLPAVRITTDDGSPVANVSVTFAVAAGGGSIEGSTTTTNADGIARVGGWTLGTRAGINTLTAFVTNLPPATFSVTSVAAAAHHLVLVTPPSATARNRVPFAVQPVLRLLDRYDNEVHESGASVSASIGSGSAAGKIYEDPSVFRDPIVETVDGVATFTKLAIGGSVQSYTVSFNGWDLVGRNLVGVSARVDMAPGDPRSLGLFTAHSRTATVGTAVATPPTVVVEDSDRNRLEGIPVLFVVMSGGGSVTGATVTTSSVGLATLGSWTLGTTVGDNTLSVLSSALPGVSLTLTARGVAGPPVVMRANGGDNQTGVAGSGANILPSVKLQDQYGNDVPSVPVTFSVTAGDGWVGDGAAFKTTTVPTRTDGVATAGYWRLGTVAGTNTLTATIAGGLPPVVFTADGAPGPPASFVFATAPSSTAVNRAPFAVQPVIQVRDAHGNFVRQTIRYFVELLSFHGEKLYGTTSVTTSNGIASFTDLSIGGPVGSYTLYFQGAGVGLHVTATVVTTPGPASMIQYDGGQAQRGPVGQPLRDPVRVKVHDGDGNGVSGIAVKFEILSGGGSISGAEQVTGEDGTASVGSWTLGPNPGGNQLHAFAPGLDGSPVLFFATGEAVAPGSVAPAVRRALRP